MENIFIQKGDLIIFDDKHKLYCGDSKDILSYKFIGNNIATICFTSPPYNTSANRYGSDLCTTQKYITDSQNITLKTTKYYGDNDAKSDDEYIDLIYECSKNALMNSKYLFFNITHSSGNLICLFDYLYKMKEHYVDTIIWSKDVSLPVIQENVLNSDFEYIYI